MENLKSIELVALLKFWSGVAPHQEMAARILEIAQALVKKESEV